MRCVAGQSPTSKRAPVVTTIPLSTADRRAIPGLIGPGSMSWEINADLASVSQAGLPAIVLEILHPSVIAGVQDLSNYREDPFQRARATLGYVLATTFGNTEAATSVIEKVKHIHSFVNGTRPDGVAISGT